MFTTIILFYGLILLIPVILSELGNKIFKGYSTWFYIFYFVIGIPAIVFITGPFYESISCVKNAGGFDTGLDNINCQFNSMRFFGLGILWHIIWFFISKNKKS